MDIPIVIDNPIIPVTVHFNNFLFKYHLHLKFLRNKLHSPNINRVDKSFAFLCVKKYNTSYVNCQ